MSDRYRMIDFPSERFDQLVADLLNPTTINDKRNRSFRNILTLLSARLNAKSVLVEENYIDVDYLSMYSGWYAAAFKPHSALTTRLHFFKKIGVRLEDVRDGAIEQLGYLGYVVVTPLTCGRIGRTLITSWQGAIDIAGQPHKPRFLSARSVVHLYGRRFSAEGSPFITQDALTIACAQASIWMTSRFVHLKYGRYGAPRHLPHGITESASHNLTWAGRLLPTDGLTVIQVINAFVNLGHFPVYHSWKCKDLAEREKALSWIVRYLDSDLPVMLTLPGPQHAVVAIGQLSATKRRVAVPTTKRLVTSDAWVGGLAINDDGPGPYLIMPRNVDEYTALESGPDSARVPPTT